MGEKPKRGQGKWEDLAVRIFTTVIVMFVVVVVAMVTGFALAVTTPTMPSFGEANTRLPISGVEVNTGNFLLVIPNGAVDLTIHPGECVEALSFQNIAEGANGFLFYGYPTLYAPQIHWYMSSGGVLPNSTVTQHICVSEEAEWGVHQGYGSFQDINIGVEVKFSVTVTITD